MSKLKEPASCKPCPSVLLPYYPDEVVVGSPMWISDIPRIKFLKCGGCITLDNVVWRNRKGQHRETRRGFYNDGMTYPWLVRMITRWKKYDPRTRRSSVTHDCPYAMYDHICSWPIPRKEADIDFLDGLRADDDRCAWIKYRAVRKWGWILWGIQSNDPLIDQWIDCLLIGDDALDEWIEKLIKEQGVD